MKIFIITEGGKNIGIGHITRCISLCQAFEEKGIKPNFVINGDDSIEELLAGRKHLIFNWLKERQRLYREIENADFVIVDSYSADLEFYKKISHIAGICVYIDDNKRIDYPKGYVLNGAVYAEEIDYPKRDDMFYLLGSRYIPIRRNFWTVPEKNINNELRTVMITFGGDDSKNMTSKISKFLNKDYPHLAKTVIIGRGFRHIKEIESLKNEKALFMYNPNAEEMKKVMLASDIAISAGGQTLYELAKVGVPTIGICVAENQIRNVQGWAKANFLEYLGTYDDTFLFEKLKKAIDYLQSPEVRRNKSAIGRDIVDGKGSLRVVDILLSSLKESKVAG